MFFEVAKISYWKQKTQEKWQHKRSILYLHLHSNTHPLLKLSQCMRWYIGTQSRAQNIF